MLNINRKSFCKNSVVLEERQYKFERESERVSERERE